MVEEESDIAAFANYKAGDAEVSTPAAAAPTPAAASPATPSKSYPDHILCEMPNLSPTMEKGNLKSWNMKVGDEVQPGDVLAGIETDKAVVDFEMQEEGFVARLLFDEGANDIPLGTAIAILVENKEDIAAFADWTPESASGAPSSSAE